MADIFIGYASEDRVRVEPLARALQAQGWSVFWAPEIPPAETWRNVLN
ncbi:MAG: toll/interleukin-1 receptor domain-containing protein [Nitrospirae bacterium]|nr:toll/interleukin-1 receptor domain-containing protein [Nitrospirota bacterium]